MVHSSRPAEHHASSASRLLVKSPDPHQSKTPLPKVDWPPFENARHIAGIAIERHIKDRELPHERDRLRLLLEITNSMTSKLSLNRLVEVLSTNLLGVTRCDFCGLLLLDAESGELRVTILYNPDSRGSLHDGALIPIHGSVCGKAFRTGKTQYSDNFEEVRH